MKNNNVIIHKIKHFKKIFDIRTYDSFVKVVTSIIHLKNWKQADLALVGNKTLRQIQYFFSWAKWCYKKLNIFRLRFLRNKPNYNNRKSDYAVLDGSAVKKDKNSIFKWMADHVFSNKYKKVVNGFYIFWSSVITNQWLKYILDFRLYFKNRYTSETTAWKQFAEKVVTKTKAWIFILDSWFKWAYFCSFIYKTLNRHFLVRIWKNQMILTKDKRFWRKKKLNKREKQKEQEKQETRKTNDNRGRKEKYPDYGECKISSFLKERNCIQLNNGKLWILNNVLIKSWLIQFNTPMQIIVFYRNGFMRPLVLVTSVNYNGEFTKSHALEIIQTYYKRWSIEMLFKEVKSWFHLESFRLQTEEAIYKFFHIIIFCHTLLTMVHDSVCCNDWLKLQVKYFLCKTRNIKKSFTVIGIKLVFESLYLNPGLFTSFASIPIDLLRNDRKLLLWEVKLL